MSNQSCSIDYIDFIISNRRNQVSGYGWCFMFWSLNAKSGFNDEIFSNTTSTGQKHSKTFVSRFRPQSEDFNGCFRSILFHGIGPHRPWYVSRVRVGVTKSHKHPAASSTVPTASVIAPCKQKACSFLSSGLPPNSCNASSANNARHRLQPGKCNISSDRGHA